MSFPALNPQGGWEAALQARALLAQKPVVPAAPIPSSPGEGWELDAWALGRLPAPIFPEDLARLRLLQKRFEVFGRLFTRYDNSVRKCSEQEASPTTMAKVALLLLQQAKAGDLSALSTAMKINDRLFRESSVCQWAHQSLLQEIEILQGMESICHP